MTNPTSGDESVLRKITALVHEEQKLYSDAASAADGADRLAAIKVELDQCWDLLRQRRALREFGENPDRAEIRPASVVEKYEQ